MQDDARSGRAARARAPAPRPAPACRSSRRRRRRASPLDSELCSAATSGLANRVRNPDEVTFHSRTTESRPRNPAESWVNVLDQMAVTRRATPPLLRALNERTVLEAIREGAPISRAEISRRSGISKPTVSLALGRCSTPASFARPRAGRTARATEPSTSRLWPRPRWCSGSTSARASSVGRSATSTGAIRARQDVELASADAAGATEAIARLRASMLDTAALDPFARRLRRRRRAGRRRRRRDAAGDRERAGLEGRRFGERSRRHSTPGDARERHQPRRTRRAVAGSRARGRRLRLPLRRHGHGRRASSSAASSIAAATAPLARSTSRSPGSARRSTRRPRRSRSSRTSSPG